MTNMRFLHRFDLNIDKARMTKGVPTPFSSTKERLPLTPRCAIRGFHEQSLIH